MHPRLNFQTPADYLPYKPQQLPLRPKMSLTPKQRALLDFVAAYVKRCGYGPRFDEMRAALAVKSKSSIARLLDQLVERGHITRLKHRHRAIELVGGPT